MNNDNFYIEKKTPNTHSLTEEEVTEMLNKKNNIAKKSIRENRKKYIIELLLKNNINPEIVNIDAMLDTEIPEWLLKLKSKTGVLFENKVLDGLIGFAVGDAMGVPVEFVRRDLLDKSPVKTMIGFGSHNVTEGTWSDDTSLTIATMDSIINNNKINYDDIMKKFIEWYENANYTADNKVFDIGIATQKALIKYKNGEEAINCGGKELYDNGNGSLMRMLPIAFFINNSNNSEFEIVKIINDVSSLTHAHEISKLGCKIYSDYVCNILKGYNKIQSLELLKHIDYQKFYSPNSLKYYKRLLTGEIINLSRESIKSTGFIVDTLEASIWCTLTSNSYRESITKAINLGEDTDTIGAITGSINGIIYGYQNIPQEWINKLKKKAYLESIASKFTESLKNTKSKKLK